MRPAFFFALLLLAQPGRAAAAADRAACADEAGAWGCVGSIEIHDQHNVYRLTVFRNGDSLSQIDEPGKVRRLLTKQAARAQLYFGLSQDELDPEHNPFSFFGEGFATPVMALDQAFPGGPTTVPFEPVRKQLKMRGGPSALTAWRLPDGSIGYQLEFAGRPTLAGTYSARRPASISDSYMAANWGPAHLQMSDAFESAPASATTATGRYRRARRPSGRIGLPFIAPGRPASSR
jgi:hypothetical protein